MSLSEALSDVMDDIGVNDRLIMKRRKASMLMEDIAVIPLLHSDVSKTFLFGSQSEGSTTLGLKSDYDLLHVINILNIIQNMSEMKHNVANFMMIQNENITPGYCHLQYVGAVKALSEPRVSHYKKYFVYDSTGKVFLNNKAMTFHAEQCAERKQCGPAFSRAATPGCTATDQVLCFYCASSPLQATSWLQKQTKSTWPSEDIKKSCRNTGCFVVPKGSEMSKTPELEWRVSTCLQERYLMFSLNITQLQCYVLMKMILKNYIKPHFNDVLTSFMCKNVLFHCAADSSLKWHKRTFLEYLLKCMLILKKCVKQRNCPHFIIPDNNLLASKMTDAERKGLLAILNHLLKHDKLYELLFKIRIDNLGIRLVKKLFTIPHCPEILSSAKISMGIYSNLLCSIATCHSDALKEILVIIFQESFQLTLKILAELLTILNGFYLPILSSTLGSVMAGSGIEKHTTISAKAYTYLISGLESDVLSGRLKLASVLYCTGDIVGTEKILKASLEQYDFSRVRTICGCYCHDESSKKKYGFMKACDDQNELQIKNLVVFCTRFLPSEINCVLPELRYELWRIHSAEDRRTKWVISKKRDISWMHFIVVDSLPYLYCLQYKVYGQLQRQSEQQLALNNLSECIDSMQDELYHKETCLNLLGQFLEQEDRQSEALGCYIFSLKHCHSNNAARWLMCLQLNHIRKK